MIKVFFDGACTPNPGGIVSYGVVIMQHEEVVYTISKVAKIPTNLSTNNTAEYCGLIAAMKYLVHKDLQHYEIYFFGDSQLVINQMSEKWEIGNGKYTAYAEIAKDMSCHFTNARFEWISREQNSKADELARKAYELRG